MSRPTPGQCVRAHCLACIGATGRTAYDCQSAICPLSPCQPWFGKVRDGVRVDCQRPGGAKRRQPSKALIAAMCYQCQEGREHCTSETCALLPYTPFQPGGQPRRELPPEELELRRASAREHLR